MTDQEDRPSPEAILAEVSDKSSGKLKIFLGSAPGVGKTYEMLRQARELKQRGEDVVIGLVETHGRYETRKLTDGLPIIPRKKISYRGRSFRELDVDAVAQRRPKLALIDELAHNNVPGSRHRKRWQDIEELLSSGIDVYTTLNVQHLTSLNDVVSQITHILIRETVPDRILEEAAEIELIDLPPGELIQRLHAGKVYVPEAAQQALHHFFSRGNLTALRELAMRVAANRVDADVVNWMRSRAVGVPWATQERLMILIGQGKDAEGLIRLGKRMADRRDVPWFVAHVSREGTGNLTRQSSLHRSLALAEELGAEVVALSGYDLVDEILAHAREKNVTQIVLGRSRRHWRYFALRPSLASALVRSSKGISITIVTDVAAPKTYSIFDWRLRAGSNYIGYGMALLVPAIAVGLSWAAWTLLGTGSLSLIFLTAVLIVAARYGRGPAFASAIVSFLALNFFFIPPYLTLRVGSRLGILSLVFFLFVAVITGQLGARLRQQMSIIRDNGRMNELLYEFSRRLNAAVGRYDIAWALQTCVQDSVNLPSVLLLASGGQLELVPGQRPEGSTSFLVDSEYEAANWAFSHNQPAGKGTGTLPSGRWYFVPLSSRADKYGVLGLELPHGLEQLSPMHRRVVFALRDQASIALEKQNLRSEISRSQVLTETERLRAALLSSVSHDLRTPLVSIIGAASTLIEMGGNLTASESSELLVGLLHEAERLNRFVQNLLDMTRIGYGTIAPNFRWHDLGEIVGDVLRSCRSILLGFHVETAVGDSVPIYTDSVLLEQILVNLLDNASKYAIPGSGIVISAWRNFSGHYLELMVDDEGPGIPEPDTDKIFDMFYRVEQQDRQTIGTGLGLAICRDLVSALDGSIRAENRADGSGARFTVRLQQPDSSEINA